MSGHEAYLRYGAVAAAVLERVGGRILWHTDVEADGDRRRERPLRRGDRRLVPEPWRPSSRSRPTRRPSARAAHRARRPRARGAHLLRVGAPSPCSAYGWRYARRLLAAALDLRGRRAAALGLRDRAAGPRHPARRAARGRGRPRRLRDRRAGPPRARASSTRCATTSRSRGPQSTPGRGLGRAARSRRRSRSTASTPRLPGGAVLARRDRRARERRPAHGLRPLGAPPQPRPRGARLAPAAGRRGRTTRSSSSTAASW